MPKALFIAETKLIYVREIYSVGLRRLLGAWRTHDWKIFHFEDFSHLDVYSSPPGHGSVFPFNLILQKRRSRKKRKVEKVEYVIAPGAKNNWSIFIINDDGVQVGNLDFQKNKISLRLIDEKTGEYQEEFKLRPMRWKSDSF